MRKVIHGEVEGTPYRAHFDREPSKKDLAALEELVRKVKEMTPEQIAKMKDVYSR